MLAQPQQIAKQQKSSQKAKFRKNIAKSKILQDSSYKFKQQSETKLNLTQPQLKAKSSKILAKKKKLAKLKLKYNSRQKQKKKTADMQHLLHSKTYT